MLLCAAALTVGGAACHDLTEVPYTQVTDANFHPTAKDLGSLIAPAYTPLRSLWMGWYGNIDTQEELKAASPLLYLDELLFCWKNDVPTIGEHVASFWDGVAAEAAAMARHLSENPLQAIAIITVATLFPHAALTVFTLVAVTQLGDPRCRARSIG